jgi:hypothetical protein
MSKRLDRPPLSAPPENEMTKKRDFIASLDRPPLSARPELYFRKDAFSSVSIGRLLVRGRRDVMGLAV